MDIQKEFIKACKVGDFDIVKSLLFNENVNPADDNNLAIQLTSLNGHFNIVELLLRNNRVINSFNIDNKNYIKKNCSKKINNFYKKYFNLYCFIDKNIFLLINLNLWLCCNTTINYKLPKQLKDFILHHYVYVYRQNL